VAGGRSRPLGMSAGPARIADNLLFFNVMGLLDAHANPMRLGG
jgi:hypothetical protein